MTARPDTGTGRDTRAHVAAGRQHTTSTTTTRGDLMTSTTPSADEVRALPYQDAAQRAIAALHSGQETFTRGQVAYLTALAFQLGAATSETTTEDPVAANLAYQAGYADGISDGEEGALAEVWEGLRFAFSGPRRQPDRRNGIRGNLTADDALWWHNRAVKQRAERQEAAAAARLPRPNDLPGGCDGVDWETGRPVRSNLRSAA